MRVGILRHAKYAPMHVRPASRVLYSVQRTAFFFCTVFCAAYGVLLLYCILYSVRRASFVLYSLQRTACFLCTVFSTAYGVLPLYCILYSVRRASFVLYSVQLTACMLLYMWSRFVYAYHEGSIRETRQVTVYTCCMFCMSLYASVCVCMYSVCFCMRWLLLFLDE